MRFGTLSSFTPEMSAYKCNEHLLTCNQEEGPAQTEPRKELAGGWPMRKDPVPSDIAGA